MKQTARLGDVAEFIRGVTYKPNDVASADDCAAIACMRTKNIQHELDESDLVYIPRAPIKIEKILRPGDIIVSSANSWNLVGKCSWVPELSYDATFGGFTSVLRAKSLSVFSRYLYQWFSTEQIQALARSFGQQTTNISNLNHKRCLELEIPLPPLQEQQRIAAILDKADALRRKRKHVVELVRGMPQSLFLQIFGDPLANPGRWNRNSPLSDVAEIGSGITKGRKQSSAALRTVPYLAVANVQDQALALSNIKTIDASEEEIQRFKLKSGDVVLTEGGDHDKLGRGTVWRDELPEAIHQNHIFRVRPDNNEVDSTYLSYLIGSKYGKNYFLKSAKQTTGIASINKSQLSKFPVLLPPLKLQRRFALEIEQLAESQLRADHADKALLGLLSSLQRCAFSGQL